MTYSRSCENNLVITAFVLDPSKLVQKGAVTPSLEGAAAAVGACV